MKRCAVLLACGCVLGTADVPAADPRNPSDLEAQLSAIAREDPDSPVLIEARLERVATVLQSTGGCEGRLALAQDAFKDASSSRALAVVLPLGSARLASLEYELHRARARCTKDHASIDKELRAALEAAQRGVDLYRDGLDYPSMAIMQFNAAATQRELGDANAAVAALTTAVNMDHEYALQDDATENERLLAQWGSPASGAAAAPVAKLPVTAQKRTAALRFGWTASDAEEKIEITSTSLEQGHKGDTTAQRTVHRQVSTSYVDHSWGWRISYSTIAAATGHAIGFTALNGGGRLFGLALPVSEALNELPALDISASGDLRGYLDLFPLSAELRDAAQATVTAAGETWTVPLYYTVAEEFDPDNVAGRAEETYGLETEAWIGATLEQGEWYQMSAGLSLPGLADTVLTHDIEFAYTRNLPCTPDAQAADCVEIVVHATPNAQALDKLLIHMSSSLHPATYWASTYARVITDPRTLTPYGLEVRRYWHMFGRPGSKRTPESAMERVVKSYRYLATPGAQSSLPAR